MSVTSVDTSKVLDVHVMSKFCHTCTVADNARQVPKEHVCTQNFKGSSGSMEVCGAKKLFHNSIDYGVRYTKYLGDGDSKAYQAVVSEQPYGEHVNIEKLECIGHIQKRMGTRLRNLEKSLRGTELDDGKSIGGKGRLMNLEIDRIQNYYGLAIRRAVSDKTGVRCMRQNIWAIYYHKSSTDRNPLHGLCPKGADSWCGYNRAVELKQPYTHKNNLPEAVLLAMKKIFIDLQQPSLLNKCLHGQTQNQNESFNNLVWTKIPKNTFVRLNSLKLGVFDVVLAFNDGYCSKLKIFEKLGLKLCKKSVDALHSMDKVRLKKADKAAEEMSKTARQARRAKRKLLEDQEMNADDQDYVRVGY